MSQLLQNHISPLDPEALAALEARGFDAEEFLQLGLGVGLEAGSSRLAVPYREQGQVVAIRTGALEGGFSGLQGAKWLGMSDPPLYNVDCLRDASLADEPLLVVESEMACWAAMVSGFRRVVGVRVLCHGRAAGNLNLRPRLSLLRDVQEWSLPPSTTSTGQKLRANIAETIGAVRCKWVSYPQGCSDLSGTSPHLRGARRSEDHRAGALVRHAGVLQHGRAAGTAAQSSIRHRHCWSGRAHAAEAW